ncbi:hypothetical protein C1H76_5525 [Elsinoe australis]|uniref:Uncharacterized protein n=1 Tax=Elsinoe australis TaxID=40998 RepID=A0A4U7AY92_9PEZI|nr:hypothetical protein C1H76_5525 [Elsinoe australis]
MTVLLALPFTCKITYQETLTAMLRTIIFHFHLDIDGNSALSLLPQEYLTRLRQVYISVIDWISDDESGDSEANPTERAEWDRLIGVIVKFSPRANL